MFADKPVQYWISLAFYLPIAPLIVASWMSFYFNSFRQTGQNWINGTVFALGFSLAMISVLKVYFLIGYRLRPVASLNSH